MKSSTILALYVVLASLDLLWGLFLSVLNYRSVKAGGGRVPPGFEGRVSPGEASKAGAYTLARIRFSLLAEPVTTAVTVLAAALGFFGLLDGAVRGWLRSEFWGAAVFLGSLAALSALLSLPFSVYSTFGLEKRYGFNTSTFGTWALDRVKATAVSLAIGLPLLWLFLAFMNAAGALWWLWASAAFSALNVVLSLLYPLVIAPLFNKFTLLPEGSLADSIRALAGRAGFRMSGIFVMDGSKRSRHSNAYFTGLGRAKRIVLYDTLVSAMREDEILAVLAHEIGHEKRKHILKRTAVSVAFSFAGFYVLSLLARWPELYAAFGFVREGAAYPTKEALLLLFGLISGPATFFLTPVFSAWSRRHEYEADRFAAQAAAPGPARKASTDGENPSAGPSGAESLSSALIRLNNDNASNLWPHPLYSFWYYSHPTLPERLRALRRDRMGRSEAS